MPDSARATGNALPQILDRLLHRYQQRVPDVAAIIAAMIAQGLISGPGDITNDHIAFRTLGVPQLGIASLQKVFLHHGYTRRDHYHFPVKHLNADWYSPPSPQLPRVFISELRVRELGENAQRILRSYTDEVSEDPVARLDLQDAAAVDGFLHQPLWRRPTRTDYLALQSESEYAAWVIYNRYYLNHFTISIHDLPRGYATIGEFVTFLEAAGHRLNDAGGKIKTSADGLLLQASTVAQLIDAEFACGRRHPIPGSYVEFAERRELPNRPGHPAALTSTGRRDGFEATNADRIFESTYASQTRARTTSRGTP